MHGVVIARASALLTAFAASVGLAAAPASAAPLLTNSEACTLSFTLTFTTSLSEIPSPRMFNIASNGGSCQGLGSNATGPADFSTNTAQTGTASCDELVDLSGVATLVLPNGSVGVTFSAAGPAFAQAWTFVAQPGGVTGLTGAGVFTWTNLSEIEACPAGGTSMTLDGVLVVAT
jgi:hypothetical protein